MAAQLEAQYVHHPQPTGEWLAKHPMQYETVNPSTPLDPYHPRIDQDDDRRYSTASSHSYASADKHYSGVPYSPVDPTDPTTVAYDRQRADNRRLSLPPMRPFGASPGLRRLVSYPASASLRRNSCAVPIQAFHPPEQRDSISSQTTSSSAEYYPVPPILLPAPSDISPPHWHNPPPAPPPPSSTWSRIQPTIDNPSQAFQSWVPPESSSTFSLDHEIESSHHRASSVGYDETVSTSSSTLAVQLGLPRETRQQTPFEIVGVPNVPPSIPESMVTWTTDADVKQTYTTRRLCYNCQTKSPPSWRKSVLFIGRILCNKCGIYERTHHKPRPFQSDEEKLRKSTVIKSTLRKPNFMTPPGHALVIAPPSWSHDKRSQPIKLRALRDKGSLSPIDPPQEPYYPHMNPHNFGALSGPGHHRTEPYAHAYASRRRSDEMAEIERYLPYHRQGRVMSLRTQCGRGTER